LAWDITVPDTYAESHLHDTACRPGAAADKAAANKSSKYCDLAGTHLFFPVAIEIAGTWNKMAVELVQEIGRRITLFTEDSRETVFCSSACPLPFNGEMRSPSSTRADFVKSIDLIQPSTCVHGTVEFRPNEKSV